MPSVLELVGQGVAVVVGLWLLARWDKASQDPEAAPSRNLRGLAAAVVCLAATAPLTAFIALGLSDKPLPVRPPGSPTSCSSSTSAEAWIVIGVVLVLAVIRLGPALVGFLVARRRVSHKRPMISGQRMFLVIGLGAAVITLVAAVRVAMGGFAPQDFTTYGAVTPPDAKGWRARAVIRRQHTGKLRALADGRPCKSDTRNTRSSLTGDRLTVDGLKAWIGGEPVNLVAAGPGRLAVQTVLSSTVAPARRPHFDRRPRMALSERPDKYLLVGKQKDGSHMAVRVSVSGSNVYARGAKRSDVGLLLRPPALPLLISLVLSCLGLVLWVKTRGLRKIAASTPRRAWGHIARLGSVALFVESTMLLWGAYRIYF